LVHAQVSNQSGTLFVVATPIGNLADLSSRALDVLSRVDLIAAEDTRHSSRLLRQHGITTATMSLHEHNEAQAAARVLQRLQAGDDVALISDAGTPLISDPGFNLLRACRESAIPVSPVPGPSAMIAALSVAGLPTDRFCFAGFLPRQAAARRERLQQLAGAPETLVFYESCHRIAASLADLVAVFGAERPAAMARELTKLHETLLRGSLAELAARVEADPDQQRGEIVLVVGGAPARADDALSAEVDKLLQVLVAQLPVRQAAALAAQWSGLKKNALYQRAQAIRDAGGR
jgi:16S rRNA (cytidine1402-2'-O)-methyltransferase